MSDAADDFVMAYFIFLASYARGVPPWLIGSRLLLKLVAAVYLVLAVVDVVIFFTGRRTRREQRS